MIKIWQNSNSYQILLFISNDMIIVAYSQLIRYLLLVTLISRFWCPKHTYRITYNISFHYILNLWVINEINFFSVTKNLKFLISNSWLTRIQTMIRASMTRYQCINDDEMAKWIVTLKEDRIYSSLIRAQNLSNLSCSEGWTSPRMHRNCSCIFVTCVSIQSMII